MSASAPFVVPSPGVGALRQELRRHPETAAAIVIVAAWLALVFLSFTDSSLMKGNRWPGGYWMLMTIAMMGPASLAGIRHTAVNSLIWRRRRAMLVFAAAYAAVWASFGAIMLGLAAFTRTTPAWTTLAFVLVVAAAWQVTPLKRRWLNECHRSIPLPPTGWVADRAVLLFGARNGLACVGSCWCLMVIMQVAPSAHVLWTAALTVMITMERMADRPLLATRRHSAVLAAAALIAGAIAISA